MADERAGPMIEELLTTAEVAARYRIDPQAVRRLVRLGRLDHINIGTRLRPVYRFTAAALDKFEHTPAA